MERFFVALVTMRRDRRAQAVNLGHSRGETKPKGILNDMSNAKFVLTCCSTVDLSKQRLDERNIPSPLKGVRSVRDFEKKQEKFSPAFSQTIRLPILSMIVRLP